MEAFDLEKLRYPNGRFKFSESCSQPELDQWIIEIGQLPEQIKNALKGVSEEQFDWVYRPDGWTIKQLLNHLIDSHSNSVIRFKLALTEEVPTLKPYREELWAMLADTTMCPVDLSLNLLDNLHQRWYILLKSMSAADWERKLVHPEHKKEFTLKQFAALYAWHGKHHLAHIELAKKSKNLF